jgi:hypothetical protein
MFQRLLVGFLSVMLVAGSAWALDPGDKCEADKLKWAGLYHSCRMKAESKAVKKGEVPDYSKCVSKFGDKWAKTESKAAGQCPTTGDQIDIDTEVSGETDLLTNLLHNPNYQEPVCWNGTLETGEDCDLGDLGGETCQSQGFSYGTLSCGAGCVFDTSRCTDQRFVDPNNGTIVDNHTGLMWEKKVAGSGCLHCVDDLYPWEPGLWEGSPSMFDWLSEVNGTSCDGESQMGFAGYSDWRIPTIVELQTILLQPYPCGTYPCIDPIFGPTADCHWSFTACTCCPAGFAWGVEFLDGFVGGAAKTSSFSVRAVRGGRD